MEREYSCKENKYGASKVFIVETFDACSEKTVSVDLLAKLIPDVPSSYYLVTFDIEQYRAFIAAEHKRLFEDEK